MLIIDRFLNSIGRHENGEIINEVLFTVTEEQGRNYLYLGFESSNRKIAECVYGDYKERYGTIHEWLKVVRKREKDRLQKITETISELDNERTKRLEIIESIEYTCNRW